MSLKGRSTMVALFGLGALTAALASFHFSTTDLAHGPFLKAYSIVEDREVQLPEQDGQSSILLFWTSTCGPCHTEMYRLQQAIVSGKVKPGRVFAINVGETREVVEQFARTTDYSFQFFAAKEEEAAKKFQVAGTPSTFHFDVSGRLVWQGRGLLGKSIAKATELFKN